MISARNISKRYGDKTVLSDICFDLPKGETLALIGPSGCGKSTLLYILAGLALPSGGTVHINGDPIENPSSATSFILQDFGLLPWKTVRKNIELGMKLRGEKPAARRKKAIDLLQELDILQHADSFPATLSGGEKQRVAIARALAPQPEILLMDEPFSALDTLTRERLQNMLIKIWQKKNFSIIMVTHSIDEAVFIGHKILVMGTGSPPVVLDNPDACNHGYRKSPAFFEKCRAVREVVEAV